MSADTIAIITTVITVGILLFGAMATMFQMQNKRIDSLENRLTAFEQQVVNRFAAMENRFTALENRLTAFEQRVENRFTALENRLTAFEQRMDDRLTAFEARFSALEQRQARLEGMVEGIIEILPRAPQSA